MIRINLLAPDRRPSARQFALSAAHGVLACCCLILVAAVSLVAWRYLALANESGRLDNEIRAARQQATRLRAVSQQVHDFEERRTRLAERLALIERLRANQAGPVHLLDEISRSLPQAVWLTEIKQLDKTDDITIEGRGTTETALPDFITNLEATGYFERPVEIVSSQVDPASPQAGGLVKFAIKAHFRTGGGA